MPKVLVCYKWVLDEQDIKIKAGDLSLDSGRAKGKISDYDKNAIEAAVLLVEKYGGSAAALTFGNTKVKQSLKDALSRGPGQAYWIGDDAIADKADAFITANILAAAIRKTDSYDLILCGEGSSDVYNQQIAPRIATLLEIPIVTFVKEIGIETEKVIATRKLGECTETIEIKGPAVISVLPEINKPRIPSLKQVMAAAKKPSAEIKVSDLGLAPDDLEPKVVVLSDAGYVMNRKNILFKEASQADNVAKLVANLAQEGIC
ncbi:MAG: electron transfer flavoprotein subunit beta/FixA family protein [Veillonellales bacterium]